MSGIAKATAFFIISSAAAAEVRVTTAELAAPRVPASSTHARDPQHCASVSTQEPGYYVSTQRFIGHSVHDSEGVRIGAINDVLFAQDGRATAVVVVSAAPWRLLARRYFRIRWGSLDLSAPESGITAALRLAEMEGVRWNKRREVLRKGETRASGIVRSKVILQNRARYGNVRDILFEPTGRLHGLVLVPAPKMGDRRGDREPHLYRRRFEVDTIRRRITLPYRQDSVPRLVQSRADCSTEQVDT